MYLFGKLFFTNLHYGIRNCDSFVRKILKDDTIVMVFFIHDVRNDIGMTFYEYGDIELIYSRNLCVNNRNIKYRKISRSNTK